ncbi:nuclear receptor coactivator 6-like [Argopecten irradians]|uniref:nuclear receptor coactivator 6-like n=1 Tax=Argopecten irradians TaxID=31199 RepID=UPI0037169B36
MSPLTVVSIVLGVVILADLTVVSLAAHKTKRPPPPRGRAPRPNGSKAFSFRGASPVKPPLPPKPRPVPFSSSGNNIRPRFAASSPISRKVQVVSPSGGLEQFSRTLQFRRPELPKPINKPPGNGRNLTTTPGTGSKQQIPPEGRPEMPKPNGRMISFSTNNRPAVQSKRLSLSFTNNRGQNQQTSGQSPTLQNGRQQPQSLPPPQNGINVLVQPSGRELPNLRNGVQPPTIVNKLQQRPQQNRRLVANVGGIPVQHGRNLRNGQQSPSPQNGRFLSTQQNGRQSPIPQNGRVQTISQNSLNPTNRQGGHLTQQSLQNSRKPQPQQNGRQALPPPNGRQPQPQQNGRQPPPPPNGRQPQPQPNGRQPPPPPNGRQPQPQPNGRQQQPPSNGPKPQPQQNGRQPPPPPPPNGRKPQPQPNGRQQQPPPNGRQPQPQPNGRQPPPPPNGRQPQPQPNGRQQQPPSNGPKPQPQQNGRQPPPPPPPNGRKPQPQQNGRQQPPPPNGRKPQPQQNGRQPPPPPNGRQPQPQQNGRQPPPLPNGLKPKLQQNGRQPLPQTNGRKPQLNGLQPPHSLYDRKHQPQQNIQKQPSPPKGSQSPTQQNGFQPQPPPNSHNLLPPQNGHQQTLQKINLKASLINDLQPTIRNGISPDGNKRKIGGIPIQAEYQALSSPTEPKLSALQIPQQQPSRKPGRQSDKNGGIAVEKGLQQSSTKNGGLKQILLQQASVQSSRLSSLPHTGNAQGSEQDNRRISSSGQNNDHPTIPSQAGLSSIRLQNVRQQKPSSRDNLSVPQKVSLQPGSQQSGRSKILLQKGRLRVTPGSRQNGLPPVNPLSESQPINPQSGRQPVNPQRGRQPVNPQSDRLQVSPQSDRQPISPQSGRQPVNPKSDRQPVTPQSDRQPVNSQSDRQLVNPKSDRQPVNPQSGRQPVNPQSGRQQVNPQSDRQLVNPQSDRQPVNPQSGRQPVNPQSGRQQVNPQSDRQQVNPQSDRQQVNPQSGRQQVNSQSDRQLVNPKNGRRRISPQSGRQPVNPQSGRQQVNPQSDRQQVNPQRGRQLVNPQSGRQPINRQSGRPRVSPGKNSPVSPQNGRSPTIPQSGRSPALPKNGQKTVQKQMILRKSGRQPTSSQNGHKQSLKGDEQRQNGRQPPPAAQSSSNSHTVPLPSNIAISPASPLQGQSFELVTNADNGDQAPGSNIGSFAMSAPEKYNKDAQNQKGNMGGISHRSKVSKTMDPADGATQMSAENQVTNSNSLRLGGKKPSGTAGQKSGLIAPSSHKVGPQKPPPKPNSTANAKKAPVNTQSQAASKSTPVISGQPLVPGTPKDQNNLTLIKSTNSGLQPTKSNSIPLANTEQVGTPRKANQVVHTSVYGASSASSAYSQKVGTSGSSTALQQKIALDVAIPQPPAETTANETAQSVVEAASVSTASVVTQPRKTGGYYYIDANGNYQYYEPPADSFSGQNINSLFYNYFPAPVETPRTPSLYYTTPSPWYEPLFVGASQEPTQKKEEDSDNH